MAVAGVPRKLAQYIAAKSVAFRQLERLQGETLGDLFKGKLLLKHARLSATQMDIFEMHTGGARDFKSVKIGLLKLDRPQDEPG